MDALMGRVSDVVDRDEEEVVFAMTWSRRARRLPLAEVSAAESMMVSVLEDILAGLIQESFQILRDEGIPRREPLGWKTRLLKRLEKCHTVSRRGTKGHVRWIIPLLYAFCSKHTCTGLSS